MRADMSRLPYADTARVRRLLTLILAVAGILLGLIAMHSVDLGASPSAAASHLHEAAEPAHAPSHPSPGVGVAAMASSTSVVGGEDCAGMCAMECLAIGMACAMALLTAVVLLGRRASDSWMPLPQQLADVARTLPRLLVPPAPPSLTALSISRT